jgi:hypothetical protein
MAGRDSSVAFAFVNPGFPFELRTATQKRQFPLGIDYQFPLFMVVAVVLQISQTTMNCHLSRIHAFSEALGV